MVVVQTRCARCEHHLRLRPEDVHVFPRTPGSLHRGWWRCPRCGGEELTVLTDDARRALDGSHAGPSRCGEPVRLGVAVRCADLPRQSPASGVPDGAEGGGRVSGQLTHDLPGELLVGDDDHRFRSDVRRDPPGQ